MVVRGTQSLLFLAVKGTQSYLFMVVRGTQSLLFMAVRGTQSVFSVCVREPSDIRANDSSHDDRWFLYGGKEDRLFSSDGHKEE